MKATIWAVALACTLIAAYAANATDFTLSDSAIMSLDYNMSAYYSPPPTASIVSKQDIPGAGVEFNIHFGSTNWPDYFLFEVSEKSHGAGTLANLDVSAYSNFDLKFTVVSIDGSTSGSGFLVVGALIGPHDGYSWAYHPEVVGLTGMYPASDVSSTSVSSPTTSVIGFTTHLWSGWSAGPHDVTLLVQPADAAVQIPEPSTIALVCMSGLALLGLRVGCRNFKSVPFPGLGDSDDSR